jgi:hypothetical protein
MYSTTYLISSTFFSRCIVLVPKHLHQINMYSAQKLPATYRKKIMIDISKSDLGMARDDEQVSLSTN